MRERDSERERGIHLIIEPVVVVVVKETQGARREHGAGTTQTERKVFHLISQRWPQHNTTHNAPSSSS